MKTLHLLRHAKSSWADGGLSDHERDLNERGRRDAPRMGAALSERCAAQPIHCSTALRARRTLEGLCAGWPAMATEAHVFTDALYTFDYRDLLRWLRGYDSAAERCFIVAHNPGLTDLCNQLVGRRALDNLPTAGYLELSLPISSWADIEELVGEASDEGVEGGEGREDGEGEGRPEIESWLFPRDLPRDRSSD